MRFLTPIFLLLGGALAALDVISGATWTARNTGRHVQAHGPGLIEDNGVYYMIGEEKTDGSAFQAVNCYSSTDLGVWNFERVILARTDEEGDLGPNRVIERPKVIRNDKTGQYVMWLHIDSPDYRDARTGVATSSTVCGEYEYRGSFRPLGFQSRDMGLFKDDDGTGYLLTEDREYGTRIIRLTDDYLGVEEVTFGWEYFAESPALVKRGDTYFIFGSHLTGWAPNDNVYSHAQSLSGPWSEWTEFAPVGSKTHGSQVSYIQPLGDSQAIYIGDRWEPENLGASTYIWLPLKFDGTDVSLDWHEGWTLDAAAGNWHDNIGTTTQEGEDAELEKGSIVIDCSQCSGSQGAGYIGGAEDGEATFVVQTKSADKATLIVKYINGDSSQRLAKVWVNGVAYHVAFLSTAHNWDTVGSSAVHVNLRQGSNTISIARSDDGGWGPDVDRLIIPAI